MTRLLLILLILSCKAHFEEETHHDDQSQVAIASSSTEGPSEEKGRVLTFVPAQYPGQPLRDRLVGTKKTQATQGPKATQTFTDAKSQERGDSEVDTGFDFLSSPLTWIGAGVVVAAGIAVALKLRKAAPV